MSLSSLRSRIAFFSERDSTIYPFPSSQEPVKKKQRGRGSRRPELDELTSAQPPRASPSPQREGSPVLFARPDLCPSAAASDMVSFGGSEDDLLDSMSLAASDAEELSGSVNDPAPLPSADTSDSRTRTGMDAELFRVLTRAVDELGLEWSPQRSPHAASSMSGSCRGAPRPLDSELLRSSLKFTRNSLNPGAPPTLRACALRLPPPSPLSTAPKTGDTRSYLPGWISGRPPLPAHCHRLEGKSFSSVQAV
ncbi:Avirulence protein AvrBs3 [Labeo rohita]|uniref:Avirulence protein AvrBs3 n=1 Tax=Labeo rohita TaxID=84645 RepID=A0ABQ8L9L0_LABRO|nr:Avirulence protein AvrBs3 [Labeo rohita]